MQRRDFIKNTLLGVAAASVAGPTALFAHGEYEENGNSVLRAPVGDAVLLSAHQLRLAKCIVSKIERLKEQIGYVYYNRIGLSEANKISTHRFSEMLFTEEEIYFIYGISKAPERYGFYGIRQCDDLLTSISEKNIVRIGPQYLFKGRSLELYRKIMEYEPNAVLTSGIRGPVKQIHLFLAKLINVGGDLREAAYSIAPIGYTYHYSGDFDVGQKNSQNLNFSKEFENTNVFRRLSDAGYLKMRYFEGNGDGVRYEPWHVKVVG